MIDSQEPLPADSSHSLLIAFTWKSDVKKQDFQDSEKKNSYSQSLKYPQRYSPD